MLYLLAVIFPPIAVFAAGKPGQAIVNFILTLFFYFPGMIHAILVVNEKKADERMEKQAELIAKANNNSNV